MARYIDADKIDYSMVSVYWETDKDGKDIYRRCAVAFESDIDELPTADVEEVKHGQWLPQVVLGERAWDCSECKTLGSPHWKRCPVCEAKMDGGNAG